MGSRYSFFTSICYVLYESIEKSLYIQGELNENRRSGGMAPRRIAGLTPRTPRICSKAAEIAELQA